MDKSSGGEPSSDGGTDKSSMSTVGPFTSMPFAASARRMAFVKSSVRLSTDTFLMCRTESSGTCRGRRRRGRAATVG